MALLHRRRTLQQPRIAIKYIPLWNLAAYALGPRVSILLYHSLPRLSLVIYLIPLLY